jgi:hypothetical protein
MEEVETEGGLLRLHLFVAVPFLCFQRLIVLAHSGRSWAVWLEEAGAASSVVQCVLPHFLPQLGFLQSAPTQ